jgi:hypothetical protein
MTQDTKYNDCVTYIKKKLTEYTEEVNNTEDATKLSELYESKHRLESTSLAELLESYNELFTLIREKITSIRDKYDTKSEDREEEVDLPEEKKKGRRGRKKKDEKEEEKVEENKEEEKIEEIEEEPKNKNKKVKEPKKAAKGKKKKDDE